MLLYLEKSSSMQTFSPFTSSEAEVKVEKLFFPPGGMSEAWMNLSTPGKDWNIDSSASSWTIFSFLDEFSTNVVSDEDIKKKLAVAHPKV